MGGSIQLINKIHLTDNNNSSNRMWHYMPCVFGRCYVLFGPRVPKSYELIFLVISCRAICSALATSEVKYTQNCRMLRSRMTLCTKKVGLVCPNERRSIKVYLIMRKGSMKISAHSVRAMECLPLDGY